MTKNDLIRKFVNGEKNGKGSNLKIEGNILINYNTIIAFRKDNLIYLNSQKYSQTTTRNQNLIRSYANNIIEIDNYNQLIDIVYNS